MRQRRSGVRPETTAARLTRHNLARCCAAIYPILTVKPHPLTEGTELSSPLSRRERGTGGEDKRSGGSGDYRLHPWLVGGRPVDRRDLAVGHAAIDGELAAVMHLVHQHEPQQVHLAHITHLLGRHEELHRLVELRVGRPLDALDEPLGRLLVRGDYLRHGGGCLRHFAELDPAVERLLACLLLRHAHPREVFRGLALGMRLQIRPAGRIGLEHPHRRRELLLQLGQKLLLLAHGSVLPSQWAWTRRASFSKHPVHPGRPARSPTAKCTPASSAGPRRGMHRSVGARCQGATRAVCSVRQYGRTEPARPTPAVWHGACTLAVRLSAQGSLVTNTRLVLLTWLGMTAPAVARAVQPGGARPTGTTS